MTESFFRSLLSQDLMGYKLLDGRLPRLLNAPRQTVVATLNPHSWVTAEHDPLFRQALQQADVLVADGVGMIWASKLLLSRSIPRITGTDVFYELMGELNQCKGRCFFLGSTPNVLALITQRLSADYPQVRVDSYSPPFMPEFNEKQVAEMALRVNVFAPDVLFLGLTAPRQEKLAERLRDQVAAKVIASIGAVFDFVAGTKPRAPSWICRLGLEWAYRLMREPRRLWQRNFISTPRFLIATLMTYLEIGGHGNWGTQYLIKV